ncbi:hypothetical protein D9M70_462740 [compost metagenome]
MREREDDRLVMVVLRLAMAESKRFCTAPNAPRSSSTLDSAASIVARGSTVAVPAWVFSRVKLPSSAMNSC